MRLGMFYKGSVSSQSQSDLGKRCNFYRKTKPINFACNAFSRWNVDLKVLVEQIRSKVEFSLPRLLFCLLCVWKQPLLSYNSIHTITNNDLTMYEEEVEPPSSRETHCSWFSRPHSCPPCGSSRQSPCTSPECYQALEDGIKISVGRYWPLNAVLSGYFGQCKKLTKSFLIASPVLYCSVCQIVNKPARF